VDVNVFKPAPEQVTDHVLFVGGLNRSEVHKGLDVLLTAMVQLRQDGRTIRLNIAGTGNRLPHYEQRAQTLGIAGQVRFLGRLTGADLVDAYTGAAVIALPTRNDSFPMVLVEAMACGLPVVSTKVGGIPELVQDETHGILVDPGHPTAFVDALRRILDDPRLGARMGRAGREKVVRTQSWARQAGRTNAIFESVLEGRPGEGTHRLAVVIPHFAPKIGGAERYAAEIAKSFNRKQGYDVTVFTSKSRGRSVVEVLDGLTVFRLSQWFTVSNTPISPMWPRKLRRAMTDNRIDLVNVHTPVPFMAESAALACRDRPLVVTYHTGSMVKNKWSVDWLIRLYERRVLPRLLRRADAVVAVSPSVRERLRPHAGPKTELVTPAVDTDVFLPELSGGQTEQAPTILFVGRIERSSASKGIDHLIKAFHLVHRELPAAQLVLVGGGDAVDDHRRAAASLGISDSVTFRGVLSGKALVEANQQSSLLALPSTTETESFGMSIIEAMACKKPVVASDVGGIPSVVDHGSDGLLVPPGDAEGLASACLEILRTPGLAAAMGEAGYRKVMELYTWPSRIDRYEEIFNAIIGSDSNSVARHGRTPSQPRTGGRS
jgi:glycosyltransferase involved in cell wall biosynthesis